MRYVIPFTGYDRQSFSRPWIAKVGEWSIPNRPNLTWGECLETFPGSQGLLEIEADPGDVIRWGQKDYQGPSTINLWGLATPEGVIVRIGAAQAYATFHHGADPTHHVQVLDVAVCRS
jgi:hypothetical protein